MNTRITRRRLITTAVTAAAGASGVGLAASLANRYGLIPPDHQGLYGVGETLTYAAQRVLTSGHSLAREFDRSQISPVAPVNGDPPTVESYQHHLDGAFTEWRLPIDGLVSRPASLSLADLKSLPGRSQITMQACEEGWSFIAEWKGAPLSSVLELVGASAAREVRVLLLLRRLVREHRHGRRAASADADRVRHERSGASSRRMALPRA